METMGQSSPEAQLPQVAKEPGLSLKGIWQVFFSPGEFFAKIRQQPKVLIPWLVLLGLMVVLAFIIKDVMADAQWQAFLQSGREMPPGMTEEQMKAMIGWSTVGMLVLFTFLTPLVGAGLLMFWGNIVLAAGKIRYKQALSVVIYGAMISAVGAIITVLLGIATNNQTFSLSLGVLVADKGLMDPTFQALSRIGLFSIWEVIAVGIGASAMYEISRNKGILLSVLSVGLQYAITVIFQFISGAMS